MTKDYKIFMQTSAKPGISNKKAGSIARAGLLDL